MLVLGDGRLGRFRHHHQLSFVFQIHARRSEVLGLVRRRRPRGQRSRPRRDDGRFAARPLVLLRILRRSLLLRGRRVASRPARRAARAALPLRRLVHGALVVVVDDLAQLRRRRGCVNFVVLRRVHRFRLRLRRLRGGSRGRGPLLPSVFVPLVPFVPVRRAVALRARTSFAPATGTFGGASRHRSTFPWRSFGPISVPAFPPAFAAGRRGVAVVRRSRRRLRLAVVEYLVRFGLDRLVQQRLLVPRVVVQELVVHGVRTQLTVAAAGAARILLEAFPTNVRFGRSLCIRLRLGTG